MYVYVLAKWQLPEYDKAPSKNFKPQIDTERYINVSKQCLYAGIYWNKIFQSGLQQFTSL